MLIIKKRFMSLDNNSAKILTEIDPSRYTVYQMLDYIKDVLKIKPVQEKINDLILIKTEPFIDSLYNFVHVSNENFSENDLESIKQFFGDSGYRIKTLENENLNNLLLADGFKLKNTSYVMIVTDLNNRDYNYILPDNVRILSSDHSNYFDGSDVKDISEDIKSVFVDAYDYLPADYDRKFGFLDQFKSDKNNKHIKSFVLYENGEPVSTGSYYAFDQFSIENIGTIKSARGQGYANLMLKILLTEAKKLGYNEACLVSSEAALAIYQKIGFAVGIKNKTYIK